MCAFWLNMFYTSPALNLARSTWHNFAEVSACSATKPRAVNESNEAPSDVNITVDGSTYPGWKMARFEKRNKNLALWKTQQASIRDQWRHLQLMEPHWKSSFRLLTVPNQNGYHSPMHPHSPSPGLVAPTSVIHKKEMDLASTARANLKLLVDPSQRTVKTKEEVKSVFKAKLVEWGWALLEK